MDDSLSYIFTNCQLYQPVTDAGVEQLEKKLDMKLPDEYLRLLQFSNGLEGTIGTHQIYVAVWNAEMLYENNQTYEAPRLIPGILIIGSAKESEAICIDMREMSETYGSFFLLPFEPLDWDEAEPLGATIEEAFEKLKNPFNLPDEAEESVSEEEE